MNLIGSLFLFLYIQCGFSQVTISAWVDKKVVPINESITLTLSITASDMFSAKPEIPQLPDFNIYQSGKSSNISIVNGQVSTTVELTYILTPRRTGKFTIPKIGVIVGNTRYFTKEIDIEVVPPSALQSQQSTGQQSYTQPKRKPLSKAQLDEIDKSNLIFAKATVDKKSAYVGEQITLSIKFYTAVPIAANPQYYPPNYSNLVSEDLPPVRSGVEVINGMRFYTAEVKTALFGIMPGAANISSAKIVAPVQEDVPLDPFDPNFIQRFFSQVYQSKDITLQTRPITLNIEALPPPPKDFSGAVGNFMITAKVDNTTLHAGDPLNITVEISGKGNIKTINPPKIEHPSIKIYDVLSSESISKNNDIVGGTKKFTYIATPVKEGNIVLDDIRFTFFNIDTKGYETIKAPPIRISVLRGKETKSVDFDQTKPSLAVMKKSGDIDYIYENIPSSLYYKIVLKFSRISMVYNAILVLIVFVIYAIGYYKEKLESDPVLYRYRKAFSDFEKRIFDVKKLKDPKKALSVIYDAIYDYFSCKLKEDVSHMTFSRLKGFIKEKGIRISDENLVQLEDVLKRIEFLNFASSSVSDADIKDISEMTIKIIKEIEKEFNGK